jgi:hypothetical protein
MSLIGLFLLVVGGYTNNSASDAVELISLDPQKYPVPNRFKKLDKFPVKISRGTGALFSPGNTTSTKLGLVQHLCVIF